MKIETSIFAIAVVTLLFASSCNKKALQTTYDNQETSIESLVSSLSKDSTTTVNYQDGVVRVTVKDGEGEALGANGDVAFYYAGHVLRGATIGGQNLFATNYDVYAESVGWSISDSTIFAIKTLSLSKDDMVEGLKRGLKGVKGGEECYVIFSGKYGFGKRVTGSIPANSALAYHLWISSVSN